jgi:hypothetical protein
MKHVINVDTIEGILLSVVKTHFGRPFYPEAIDESEELSQAYKDLHSLLISKLPEKKEWGKLEDPYDNPDKQDGFNEAIDEVKAGYDEMFGVGDE